jgi:probable addiction module antidote protein
VRKVKSLQHLTYFSMGCPAQLNSEADIAAYITLVIEEGDAAELAHALGVAARARGMTEMHMLPG